MGDDKAYADLEAAIANLAIERMPILRAERVGPSRSGSLVDLKIADWLEATRIADIAAISVSLSGQNIDALTLISRRLTEVVERIVPGLDLSKASLESCRPVVGALTSFLDARRSALQSAVRDAEDKAGPLGRLRAARVYADLGLDDDAQAILDGFSSEHRGRPPYVAASAHVLSRQGRLAEALGIAIDALRRWPADGQLASVVRDLSRRQGRFDYLQIPPPPPPQPMTLDYARQTVDDLLYQRKALAALETIWNLRRLFFAGPSGLMEVFRIVLARLGSDAVIRSPAFAGQLETLPPDTRLTLTKLANLGTPERLAAIAGQSARGARLEFWHRLARLSYDTARLAVGNVADPAAADWILNRSGGGAHRERYAAAAASQGYRVANNDLAGLKRSILLAAAWNSGAYLNYDSARRSLTERGRAFLEQVRFSGTGAFVFTVHAHQDVGLQKHLLSVAVCSFGLRSLNLRRRANEPDHPGRSILDKLPLAPEYISRLLIGPLDLAAQLAGAAREGGVAQIPIDHAWDFTDAVTVPWLVRPHSLASYVGRVALMADAAIAFGASYSDTDSDFVVDFSVIQSPPRTYSLKTRSAWLLQRLGRQVRSSYREQQIALSVDQITSAGGVPMLRELTPADVYLNRHADARSGLFGGLLFDDAYPLSTTCLRTERTETTFGDLRRRALTCAALLLHFQELKPDHMRGRSFRDQHRVMAILQPGEGLIELGLGALAAGSLLCVCQTDTPIETVEQRIGSFRPDLVIAAASVADRLRDGVWSAAPILVCDDAGDGPAIDDLTFSFAPAQGVPAFDADRPALVVFTSGSTGTPKAVTVTHRIHSHGIRETLREDSRHAAMPRWDSIGFAGLITILREGSVLHVIPPSVTTTPTALVDFFKRWDITALSAPSTVWHGLARSADFSAVNLPAFRGGVAWGERLAAWAVEAVAHSFPAAWLAVSYGATEASHASLRVVLSDGISRAAEATLIEPARGTSLRLVDEAGNDQSERGGVGRVEITSDNVMLGYFDELFANNPATPLAGRRTLLLGDLATAVEGRLFKLVGRDDSIIKVGGRRVSLLEIEAAAESVKGVIRAVALARDGALTTDVLLAVEADADVSIREIADRIAAKTFPEARPRRIRKVERLPMLPAGKTDPEAVRRLFDDAAVAEEGSGAIVAPGRANGGPRTPEVVIAAMSSWLEQNGWKVEADQIADISLVDNYFDSILQLELLMHLEKEFGVILDHRLFGGETSLTFGSLARALAESPAASSRAQGLFPVQ
jgi:acyl-coenzyme A synthetase/AMP-(fatty) acid ligase